MKYIQRTPNPSGAYPAPQSSKFPGAIELTEEQCSVLIQYNGFVTISDDGAVSPDLTAWEAWKASLPEPEEPEQTTEDLLLELAADHEARLCEMELGV